MSKYIRSDDNATMIEITPHVATEIRLPKSTAAQPRAPYP